ncbi:MAG: PASTA domain-containing protein [Actinobacteria bacterium]|nr:PASTA domain-containing protein [Actinomycetota bacterium]
MGTQDSLIGALFANRYRIRDSRSGGSGESSVYDATDVRSHKRVVIRVLTAKSLIDLDSGVVLIADAVELFKRQTQMLASMSHPSLASIDDWGTQEVEGTLYAFTVLEHYAGGTLREILDRGRRLNPSQALAVGLDVCRALHFLHGKGWVHGDLRPANIFLGDDSRVRLAGLGLKRVVHSEQMSIEQASYAAPEIATGQQPTEQSDVYSLALTLLEMITGTLPFVGDTAAITLAARIDKLLPVSADLGPIAAPIERAGRPEAGERFSAVDFGRAFAAIADKMPMPQPIEPLESKSFEAVIEEKIVDRTGEIARPVVPSAAEQKMIIDNSDEPIYIANPAEIKRHKRIVAIGAVVALLMAGGISYRIFAKRSHEVPVIAEMNEGEVRNLVVPFKWTIVVTAERSDEVPAGNVIRTEPATGESLEEGKTLTLVISQGPSLAQLPDLVGKTLQEAVDALTALELVPAQKDLSSEDVAAGSVISWLVPEQPSLIPGDKVLRGTAIDVLISTGPAPREMPSLIGMTLEQAQTVMNELSLVLVETPAAKSNGAAAGLIGAQSVVPGTQIARDAQVAYLISLGPDLVEMPRIIGNSFATVEPRLLEAGFVVGKVTGRPNYKLRKAFVGDKAITNGDQVPRGATIDLVFP